MESSTPARTLNRRPHGQTLTNGYPGRLIELARATDQTALRKKRITNIGECMSNAGGSIRRTRGWGHLRPCFRRDPIGEKFHALNTGRTPSENGLQSQRRMGSEDCFCIGTTLYEGRTEMKPLASSEH